MRILIAPQEFKGSLTADEAARAIAAGIRGAQPEWELDVLPLADGGYGFLDAMRTALGGTVRTVDAHDPLGRPVVCQYLVLPDGTAVIEAAQANGLLLVAESERDALRADTFGVGELILGAVRERARAVMIGVGGSATTDGGAGMARALGARLLDSDGRALGPGGAPLTQLAHIEWRAPEWARRVRVVVATDVTNPLVGEAGAARVYAPQKGADSAEVELLERALERYAEVVERDLGVGIAEVAGGGAAGGLAAGLVAFPGASIASGFEVVAEATRLRERLAASDVVVTGEGSFDAQSRQGKTTGRVLELAEEVGRPCAVLAGRSSERGTEVRTLAEVEPDHARAMTNSQALLEELAARWARDFEDGQES